MIADDHEVLRRGVRTLLGTESEWEICGEAIDGKDAVDKSAALSPDLVILDVNMPVLNGLAAVRQILRLRPQPKVLVFTVHDSDQTMMEVQATGAHGYLSKAKAQQDLIHAVKALLAGKDFYRPVPARRGNSPPLGFSHRRQSPHAPEPSHGVTRVPSSTSTIFLLFPPTGLRLLPIQR